MEHRHSNSANMMLLYDSEKCGAGNEFEDDKIE